MIGIIGEDPYDKNSIKNILGKYYDVYLKILLKKIKGSQLDSPKAKKMLGIELKTAKYDFIIYSRDLDGLRSEATKIRKAKQWFEGLDKLHKNAGILLLHIYELEALILADIETFNKLYGTKINKKNPEFQKEPKEFLMRATRKLPKQYKESENPDLFKKLDKAILEKNCHYFKVFIEELEGKLA